MKKIIVTIIVLSLFFTLLASGYSKSKDEEKNITVRLGFAVSIDTVPGKAFVLFKEEVEKNTGGRIKVDLYENATLGNDRDLVEGLTMGTVEMAGAAIGPLVNFSPEFRIWDLPYVVENTEEGLARAFLVMDGDIGHAMWASLEKINVKGLFITYTGFRNIINSKKDVATPADIIGLKIRTMENSIHQNFYSSAGATVVTLASSEAFTALQQKTIDGMDNVLDAMSDQGAFDIAKHLTLTEHLIGGYVFMVAKDFFYSLSVEDQEVILNAAEQAKILTRELARTCREDYVQRAEDKGVKVTYVDYNDWMPAAKKVWDLNKDEINQEWFSALTGK